MATEVGESEPISEILHAVETRMSESSKGKTIIEAPIKDTISQYVTIVSAKLENERCLTSNGNKDDAAKKFIPKVAPDTNEVDAENNTDDQVTKFDITEVSEAQVRDKEQKFEVHEVEHAEIEAITGNFSNERINGIDSTQESLEITAEARPLDAVAIELEAEKLERLKEDKQVQIGARTGSSNDERSFEITSVAETLKSSEPAGNETKGGKLEGTLDAVPKDSESLNFERVENDKNVETEAETGGLGDETASKDIHSIYVTEPSEEESTQESLQIDPRQNLEPAEDEPGGENLVVIPDEPKEEKLQQVNEEKHDNVEAETETFNEEITTDFPEIEDKEKLDPAEYKPEGCEPATKIDVVPKELEEKNLERVNQDEHVKTEEETENINDRSTNEIISVSEPSEKETMQQPPETTSEGDIEHAGEEPEGEKLENPLEPVSQKPEEENLERVEEYNKHTAQAESLNSEISNETEHLSLAESAEEEITQDPPKTMTEEDPELAKDEPEDAKLESTLHVVLQEPEVEKHERVEEDKLVADTESSEGERANDINSITFAEAEDTRESLGTMTEETPEPAQEEPEGGKLESSLDEFPNQTEAEKLEIIEEKHVEIEAETGSFSDERADDIDSIYITEPLEKLNAQERLESMTEEDLVLARDESKGEKPLEALLEEPEEITPASMLPRSVPNSSEITSQRETEKISKQREGAVGLVLEEIKGATNCEKSNSESDKKDKEVKNDDNQNDVVFEESPISASEDRIDEVTTISTDDTKDNDFNEIMSAKLELASELIPEQKSEETGIENKDKKFEHSTHDVNNSYKSTEENELSKEGEAVNEVVEDSIGTDAIKETTEEKSDMLEDSKKVSSENTWTNEVIVENEIANEERESSNKFDIAKGTPTDVSETDEDATILTSQRSQIIDKEAVLQETQLEPDMCIQLVSQEHEHKHETIVDSEADAESFGEVNTMDKALEDLSTSQASEKDNLGKVTETKVASDLMVEKDIHGNTEETRSTEGEVTSEMLCLQEQMVSENLEKTEVEQGKESSIAAVDSERRLQEMDSEKTIESAIEKEIYEDKLETSQAVAKDVKEIKELQEVEKMDSFKEKEECIADEDNQEVAKMGTEDLSCRVDDAQAELINEFETSNEENISSNEVNMAKETATGGGEMYGDATTSELSQTTNKDPVKEEIEIDCKEASQSVSQKQEKGRDSIVDSKAASPEEVYISNKAFEDLSTSQTSKEENTRESTGLKMAKEQISTETNQDEIQDRSIVEETDVMIGKDIHEETRESRSIETEVTPETSSLDEQKVTEILNKNNESEAEQEKKMFEKTADGERSLEETEVDKTIDCVMEKENWKGKVEIPSKVMDEEIIEINDLQEVEMGDSYEAKKECFTNKDEVGLMHIQAVDGVGDEVVSSTVDNEHEMLRVAGIIEGTETTVNTYKGDSFSSHAAEVQPRSYMRPENLSYSDVVVKEEEYDGVAEMHQDVQQIACIESNREVSEQEEKETLDINPDKDEKIPSLRTENATDTKSGLHLEENVVENTCDLDSHDKLENADKFEVKDEEIPTDGEILNNEERDEDDTKNGITVEEITETNELSNEFQTANKENKNSNEDGMAKGTTIEVGEMNEDATNSTSKISQMISTQQEIEIDSNQVTTPIFQEQEEHSHDSIVHSEAKTMERAPEEPLENDNLCEAKEQISTENNEGEVHNVSMVENTEFVGTKDIHESIEGEPAPEMSSLEEQKFTENLEDNIELEVAQGKQTPVGTVGGERSLEETAGDKTVDGDQQKEVWKDKIETPSEMAQEESIEVNDSHENRKKESSEEKEECFTKAEITDTNELRNEFETANEENKSLKEDDMAKRTTTEGGEMNEDATYSTSELTQTISTDLIVQETEIDSDQASEPISQEMEYSHDSIVESAANTIEKKVEVSEDDNIYEATEEKLAKEQVATENNDEDIHYLSMVENTEFVGANDIHQSSEDGKTAEKSSFEEQKLTENLEDITMLEVGQGKETSIGILGGERSLEESAGDETMDSVQQKELLEDKIETPTKVAEEEIIEINDSQEVAKRDSFKEKEECFTNTEIPEMAELNDCEEKEKCETNLNNGVDGSPSSHELLDETKDIEVGETTKVDDETNQSTDKEAYDTECEQLNQVINAKGDVKVNDHKQNGEVEKFEFVKELVPRDDNQKDLREQEVTDDTIHDDNLDTVIPESVGDTCNLAPDDAEEAQKKVIQDDDTKNEIIIEEVNKSAVTVETPVPEVVNQVINADAYECQAYEEKGEHKENTSTSLFLEKSVNNEDEKTKEVLDDLAVTNALSDKAAYGQEDQREQATEEDYMTRDGNPNEQNDKTASQNTESAVEELKNSGGRIISDNTPGMLTLNEETKEGEKRQEKEADSSNEEKDHSDLNEVVVCENNKISEETESKGGEACKASLTSQEIEGGELHTTNEIISEEKQEILELENNEGEEISNRDISSNEPDVVESEHLSLQTLKKEEENQQINDTDEEDKEAVLESQTNIETTSDVSLQKEEQGDKLQGKENDIETGQKSYETSNGKKIMKNETFEEQETAENGLERIEMVDQQPEITPFVVVEHHERETAAGDIYEGETQKGSTETHKEEKFQKDEDIMLVKPMIESEHSNQINNPRCQTDVLEAEQSDILIAQIEKIAEGSEVLNTKVAKDDSQEMANPMEGIENKMVSEEESIEVNESAVKTVPHDEDEETKQEVGEKFSKISDYWPELDKEETSNVNAMTIERSKEILTEAGRSPCEINEKGEEVLCAVKASELDAICYGEEKLDDKVNSSMKPIEDKESSREVVIKTEDDDKASNENDESDNLPVSHFLMKHILREQADNLDRIGDEKYEDPINKQNEEGKENEMNILKQEEVLINESTIPEDEVKPKKFKNMSELVQEELDHDVKEKSEILVSKDDASKLFEVSTHSFMDDSVELKSNEQSIQESEVDIEQHKDPNVMQDAKNHATIVERAMTEMETHKENESQEKYEDIFQKEYGEESKEFHQDIEKVESESQSTKDGSKIEEILEIEYEVNNGESGEEKQQGGAESKFNIKKVESERQSSKEDGEIKEILQIESGVNKEESEKKQEGGKESRKFQQDIEKVEFVEQSTKANCKIEEIESEVTKEESEDEKHEVEIKGKWDVKEELDLEQPEIQNNGEMELKKEREEEYEPDHSTQNAAQTSELEPTQKCVPTSKTFESSAVEDFNLECEEEKEDVMDGNQEKILKNTQVEDDKTGEEKYGNEDEAQEPEESGNEETIMVEAREVELKPTNKKSHNILSGVGSKVKHSFAKVKKAITRKSSHTKTLSAK